MRFSCTQENLQWALQLVSHIPGTGVTLPILENIHIDAQEEGIYLTVTNLKTTIQVRIRGKVEQTGSFTLPAKVFANYIGLVSADRIDVEQDGNSVVVSAGNQNTRINGLPATEYPPIPSFEKKRELQVDVPQFKQSLSQALIAVAHDDSIPEYTGILYAVRDSQLVLAATDSYRLAEKQLPIRQDEGTLPLGDGSSDEPTLIVPSYAMYELVRMLNDAEDDVLHIQVSDAQARFVLSDVELTTDIVDAHFPNYQQIIPQGQQTVATFKKGEMAQAVKAASLFSKSGIHDVHLHFDPKKQGITVTTVNNQIGEHVARINAEVEGEENRVTFNYRYLLDGLTQVGGDDIRIQVVDSRTPCLFVPKNNGENQYRHMIMPIRE